MKVFYWIVLATAALALALFAASNRAPVAVAFWPFGAALELPLYLALLLTFMVGIVCGALAAWISGRHWRLEARRRRRSMAALEQELAATQAQMPGAAPLSPAPPQRPRTEITPPPPDHDARNGRSRSVAAGG